MPKSPLVNCSVSASTTAKGTWSSEKYWSSPQYLPICQSHLLCTKWCLWCRWYASRVYPGYTKMEKAYGVLRYGVHQAQEWWTWNVQPQDWTGPWTTTVRGHSTLLWCPQTVSCSIQVHSSPNPFITLQVPTNRLLLAPTETCQIKLRVRSIKTLFAYCLLITFILCFHHVSHSNSVPHI